MKWLCGCFGGACSKAKVTQEKVNVWSNSGRWLSHSDQQEERNALSEFWVKFRTSRTWWAQKWGQVAGMWCDVIKRRAIEGVERKVLWSEWQSWKWSVQQLCVFIRASLVFVEKRMWQLRQEMSVWRSVFPLYVAAHICLHRSFNCLLRFLLLILQFS